MGATVDGELQGTNRLGELLMQIRSELRSNGLDECRLRWKSEADSALELEKIRCSEEEVKDDTEYALEPCFAAWLRAALSEEILEADCEGAMAAVEVVLAGADADDEALGNAVKIVEEFGAPRCAEEFRSQWRS